MLRAQHHGAPLGAVLHRIVDEIGEDLLEGAPVTLDVEAARADETGRDPFLVRALTEKAEEMRGERLEPEALGTELELSRLDPREIEQVFDELAQTSCIALNDSEEASGTDRVAVDRHV